MKNLTISQVRNLIGLGVDFDSADMTVKNVPWVNGSFVELTTPRKFTDKFHEITTGNGELLPSWSSEKLLELLPKSIKVNDEDYFLRINWEDNIPMLMYSNSLHKTYRFQKNESHYKVSPDSDSLLDAVYQMVTWIIKEGFELNKISWDE